MTDVVLAANTWPTNAELIEDVAKLGYLWHGWDILDATYGRGTWWKRWQPKTGMLIRNDIKHRDVIELWDSPVHTWFDFRSFPDRWAGRFDAVAFDPPYVCVGGRKTTTMPDFHDRYGLTAAPKTPFDLQELINDGLAECQRVTKSGGFLLVKCQDYISSGELWPGTLKTHYFAAANLGLKLVDRFEHVSPSPRPQPPGRRQVHARRNLSTLLVFRKP